MNISRWSIQLISGLAIVTANAQPIIEVGTTEDLWDISRGSTVTRTSGAAAPFQPENAFGARLPTPFGNPLYDFIFIDGQTNGFVHFLEWKTPSPVTVRSFRLHAQGDGAVNDNGREFEHFVLKSKTIGSASFDSVLYCFTARHPFRLRDSRQRIVLAANIAPITAQEFRAEFTDRANRFYSGPRVIELDGFAERLPLEIYPAVELVWETELGKKYQAEWSPSLFIPTWSPLGEQFVGDGQLISFLDSTRSDSDQTRYYRMVELP